ncbi:MAG: mannosyl-3-phosphoglycerate synthase [Ktedonobacteraceae bacterium]
MNIDTVRFSHLLEVNELNDLNYFLSHTAFVISHKSESLETLLGVLWYLPVNSPIIIVTNCPEEERQTIELGLKERLAQHKNTYLVHQKDEFVAAILRDVPQILGDDGRVVNGKGEGMYIGTICAAQLGYAEWIIYYDADNFVPSALLEYTMAMSRLFMAARAGRAHSKDAVVLNEWHTGDYTTPDLHNIRICWSSKPALGNANQEVKLLGRCTRVVSPLFTSLLDGWFGIPNYPVVSSNAGEQGMTIQTATTIRFSSGYSVETFQFLDLLYHASRWQVEPKSATLQQYQSKSPHFHDKKDDPHIKKMIADSLGAFVLFEKFLPRNVKKHMRLVYLEHDLEVRHPNVYPSVADLHLEQFGPFTDYYRLFRSEDVFPILVPSIGDLPYANEEEVSCGLL